MRESIARASRRFTAALGSLGLKDLVSLGLSVVALLLSIYSVQASNRAARDASRLDTVKTQYSLFRDLAAVQLQHPLMSHMFSTDDRNYDFNVTRIASSGAAKDAAQKAKLLLEEEGVANYIFTTYEETYQYWDRARKEHDDARVTLLGKDLSYYSSLLCNRRLLWYWDIDNGLGYATQYDIEVTNYYIARVLHSCPMKADPKGPFGR